ncbi:uncharacterized protein BDR25DRAFT_318300 [Lindgomyces ingoldianus]|uniref:Uncharacterized protein n=1 Tax=Lindgomyces ingoldianus TaxID=673940 RepID=A0ACB6QEX7_9PLEO|nr:uncharacterized protein BDR25DRAFT_318300 [Lindgomyces ingoldianus]KAF2465420.1 hypothetical protein BDR25DRAFT_318300 [Lindgomyces ingoldianus]
MVMLVSPEVPQFAIEIRSRDNQDVAFYYVEAAVGAYDRSKWAVDLNILNVFKYPFSRIMSECKKPYKYPLLREEFHKVASIDSWEGLLYNPPDVSAMRARGNWQAKLAATAFSIQQGYETRIVPDKTYWTCPLSLRRIPRASGKKSYDAVAFRREGSDREAEEIAEAPSTRD